MRRLRFELGLYSKIGLGLGTICGRRKGYKKSFQLELVTFGTFIDQLIQFLKSVPSDILVGMLKKERGRVANLKTNAETSQTRALSDHRDTQGKEVKTRLSRHRSSSSHGESSENEAQTSLEVR